MRTVYEVKLQYINVKDKMVENCLQALGLARIWLALVITCQRTLEIPFKTL